VINLQMCCGNSLLLNLIAAKTGAWRGADWQEY